ncbi:hypothetical protein GCM10010326_26630 [Streptomyces xanthochromogenes]|uniref:Uncharacterized protein n=1 Tax=Streptomyces xanthochromogenes TaxID=67384 RepID=A0ABQ3A461_9ACTN|nr:hypothetical protein GCM10010326_26630 [Streptomyces xanthochromogenes]
MKARQRPAVFGFWGSVRYGVRVKQIRSYGVPARVPQGRAVRQAFSPVPAPAPARFIISAMSNVSDAGGAVTATLVP